MFRRFISFLVDAGFLAYGFHWAGEETSIAGRVLGPQLTWGLVSIVSVVLAALASQSGREAERGSLVPRLQWVVLAVLAWPALLELTNSALHRKRVVLMCAVTLAYLLILAPALHAMVRRAGRRGPLVEGVALAILALALLRPWFGTMTGGAHSPGAGVEPRWNLLMVTVDTTRADFLGCYGQELASSPQVDALAREGVLFERAFAHAPHTHSSMSSLLTSTYPIEHRSIVGTPRLRTELNTLAEQLWINGYQTAAFFDNPWLTEEFGFDQGYLEFEETSDTDQVLEWLEGHAEKPFFLHVHYLHPHGPYEPQEPWVTEFDPGYDGEWSRVDSEFLDDGELAGFANLSETDLRHFHALYAAEIRRMDAEIGRILARLSELKLDEQTLVVFVADHGEEFLDHEALNHSHTLFEELLHVPLIMRWPGHLPGGTRIGQTAELVDVLPTILQLLELPALESARGRSLVGLVSGSPGPADQDPSHVAIAQRYFMIHRHLLAARKGRWKLQVVITPSGPDQLNDWTVKEPEGRDFLWRNLYRLYDLEADPGEMVDVSSQHPDVVRELLEDIQRWRLENDPGTPSMVGAGDGESFSPATLKRLRDLGYIGEADALESKSAK